jgi:predicted CopG family antitoxin
MNDTSIRVSNETKQRLELHKREDESYDEVIRRLTEDDKWAGFGALADSDIRSGMETMRERTRSGMDERIEDME